MSISFRKLMFPAAVLMVAMVAPVSAGAADLVGGYYAPSQSHHYRGTRVVRTAYMRREVRDCQLLRITDPDGSRVVEVCFKPIF